MKQVLRIYTQTEEQIEVKFEIGIQICDPAMEALQTLLIKQSKTNLCLTTGTKISSKL